MKCEECPYYEELKPTGIKECRKTHRFFSIDDSKEREISGKPQWCPAKGKVVEIC